MAKNNDLTVIIPAAGLGRRMKSYGPKSLVELANGQTVIARQLELIKVTFPTSDVVVVVGYEADKLCKHLPQYVRTVENELYEYTNVSRSIELALRASRCKRALIIFGDLVFDRELLGNIMPLRDSFVVVENQNGRQHEVGVNIVDEKAACFSYGLEHQWAHIAYLTGKELEIFKKVASQKEKRKHFAFEILNDVIDRGGQITVKHTNSSLVEIDVSKNIADAQLII